MAVGYSSSSIGQYQEVRLWPKTDLKGHTVSRSSKFEAHHLPNPVAARDGSYLAAAEQPSWLPILRVSSG
jgi:hypothetical protein